MPLTTQEFENFAEFGRARLQNGATDVTLDELVVEWESLHCRDQVNAAIREGIVDAEAGRHRDAREVMAELRQKHKLPNA